jgi:uncharacterized membrane protein
MRNNFFTGLALLLPVALTFWILNFLILFLTDPFLNVMENFLLYYHLIDRPFLVFWSRLFILLLIGFILLAFGFFGGVLISKTFRAMEKYLIDKIPIVNRIYNGAREIVDTLFGSDKSTFSRVVLVPFPHEKSYCLGFVANETPHEKSDLAYDDRVSIFVAGAPNPTFGLMILYKKDQLIPLDLKVDEALKYLVSCGVTPVNFQSNKLG